MAEINVFAPVTVQLTDKDVAEVLMNVVFERLGRVDDAGCDWVTGANGDTYIAYPAGALEMSQDPAIATLVDAANTLRLGKTLHT